MHPVLMWLQIGDHRVALGSYATFMTLGWIAMIVLATGLAHARGLPWRGAFCVFSAALLGGVAGARVLDVATNGGLHVSTLHLLWRPSFQGFALYGGLMCGSLVAVVLARRLRLSVWRLADCAVPALAVGIALMRAGCFLRGCCFGTASDLPWAVTFPVGSPAWAQQLLSGQTGVLGMAGGVLPVHPTQLYELAAALILAAGVALWHRRRVLPDGAAFLVFAIGFSLFRLANGTVRVALPEDTSPTWFYPLLYVAVVIAAGILLQLRLAARRDAGRAMATESRATEPPPLPWEAAAEGALATGADPGP
jgi:phosphatidylglycerol:prolipoprotein diacylglycerol transferase